MNQENIEFLSSLFNDGGFICVAQLLPPGSKTPFKHYWYQTVEEAAKRLVGLDRGGYNAYIGQATFLTDLNRKQDNSKSVQSIFYDVDCGDKKPYATQIEAAAAIKAYCDATKLPLPSIMSSGYGLYCHWRFTAPIPVGIWRNTSAMSKALTQLKGFHVDPSRTTDTSSVLRPPGVHNFKDPRNPRPTQLMYTAEPIDHEEFRRIVIEASGTKVPVAYTGRKAKELDEFAINEIHAPSYPDLIADKCQQMNAFRSTKGDLSEPLWYALLGVVKHCVDGHDTAHEWSSGHPDYSPAETERKLSQSDTGPTTCNHIKTQNAVGCIGCRFDGKITSPIQLGRKAPEPVKAEDGTNLFGEVSFGYRIAEDGLWHQEDDIWVHVYPHPVCVDSLVFDSAAGHEVAVIRHRDPQGKWQEVAVRSALIHDMKQLVMSMHDQHLQAPSGDMGKVFMWYIANEIRRIRESAPIQLATSQMGWREFGEGEPLAFVLGDEIHYKDGSTTQVGFSKSVPEVARAFNRRGDLQAWVTATRGLGREGYEPQAFAFVAGAFGAPLMRVTGFPGAIVSMIGSSGVGKTLVGNMILSTYGEPSRLMLLRDDTRNAMIARLGVYGSLPCYVDEVSNMPPEELSDFAYRITQGRDKARLTKVSVEKSNINAWNTLAIASSNHSIIERLAMHKADASAEFNRIVEYHVNEEFPRKEATAMYRAVQTNYGHAGRAYAKYLVENQDRLKEDIDAMTAIIDQHTGATNDERFWSATIACGIYGGLLAKKLGLIDFDVARLIPWAVKTVREMRKNKRDSTQDVAAVLSSIIDKYIGGTIVIEKQFKGGNATTDVFVRGGIVARLERESGTYWISKAILKQELQKRFVSWAKFKEELADVIVSVDERITLGRGTFMAGTMQPCVKIKLAGTRLSEKLSIVRYKGEESTEGRSEERSATT